MGGGENPGGRNPCSDSTQKRGRSGEGIPAGKCDVLSRFPARGVTERAKHAGSGGLRSAVVNGESKILSGSAFSSAIIGRGDSEIALPCGCPAVSSAALGECVLFPDECAVFPGGAGFLSVSADFFRVVRAFCRRVRIFCERVRAFYGRVRVFYSGCGLFPGECVIFADD